jgi:hypothetical protein
VGLIHKLIIVVLGHSLKVVFCKFGDAVSSKAYCVEISDQRDQFELLQLVVDYWDLVFVVVSELFPEKGIPRSNRNTLSVHFRPDRRDKLTDDHHSRVNNLWISIKLKVALSAEANILTQHIGPWDPDMIHHQVSVVLGQESELWPHISNIDSW